jgi:hypothetical protein
MSYRPDPSGNPEAENDTPILKEVIRRAPQTCEHEQSISGLSQRWRNFWNEKMCLLWLKADGMDWQNIIQWFAEKGTRKNQKALSAEWGRVSNEVGIWSPILGRNILRRQIKAMREAGERCKELCETASLLGFEPLDPWDSISASMKDCGAKESWTPGKVKYSWHHGASTLLRDVLILCLDG